MTEDAPLTETQLSELREALEKAMADSTRERSASSAEAKPVDLSLSIGRLSRIDAIQQQHMALARRQRSDDQLRQIASALSRIAAGDYGSCLGCDEPIGYARLRVRPETTLCRDCQAAGGR